MWCGKDSSAIIPGRLIEKKLESIPIEGDTAKILTSLPPLFGPSEILILYPLSRKKIQCSPHITTWNLMMAVIF